MILAKQNLIVLALAGMAAALAPVADAAPQLAYIQEHGPVLAPFSHVMFCMKNPGECVNKGRGGAIAMTPVTMDLLNSVNEAVNRAIIPRNDPAGTDVWNVSPKYGDCKDYAITKRKRLVDAGLPSAATRLAIAVTPEGIGHVVVVERTTVGDLILDNRTDAIKPWHDVDLKWIKIQSTANPRLWKDIGERKPLGF